MVLSKKQNTRFGGGALVDDQLGLGPAEKCHSNASGLSGSVTGTTVDAIQQGLQKEAVVSLNASVKYQHMDGPGMSGQT
ncbi:hypothetical protein TNCV_1682201 [Trichonephila clavipes]|nr:hypothetical protein TNCV_1682201 [Trichonephila clavipes]